MATTLASSLKTSPRSPGAPALAHSLRAAASLWLLICLCACEQREPLPGLPGVTDESRVWFWRDVLAAPLPSESAPDSATLALSSPSDRVDALAALVSQQHPALLPTAMALLRDENVGVACAAAEALGQLGNEGAIPRLLKGIGPYPVDFEPSIHVRAAEASALAALGNPAGIPLILDLLAEDTDAEVDRSQLAWTETSQMVFVRELALPGLVALSGSDFDYIPNGTFAEREAAVHKARAWWAQHRDRLWAKAPLDHPAIVTRARLLVSHLDAYQLRQVDGARFALAHMGPPVLRHLQEGLESDNTYVRMHVLEVMERLCELAEPKIKARLAIVAAGPLLDDVDLRVAAQAASVCAAAEIIDPLVAAVARRREPVVQLALVDALGRSGQSLAHTLLLETFGTPTEPAVMARRADFRVAFEAALLATDLTRSPDTFVTMLSSDDADIVYPALERLILYTGSDHGLDPSSSPADRSDAILSVKKALAQR